MRIFLLCIQPLIGHAGRAVLYVDGAAEGEAFLGNAFLHDVIVRMSVNA